MENKPKIFMPIVVEGRYDKSHITSLFDCYVITTDGFGIFKDSEKTDLLKKLSKNQGVIILTDSDGGGLVIRNYLKSILPKEKIVNLYIPQIKGKEKRKECESKEGLLGVEGISKDILYNILLPYSTESQDQNKDNKITKMDLYRDGLIGTDGCLEKRKIIAKKLGIPTNISSNSFVEAINRLSLQDQYRKVLDDGKN